ncbi:MAG: hypothetical protein IJX98_03395 [Clostridia bacterium]|nr:hypothetical protein [Clostridia bacterium]
MTVKEKLKIRRMERNWKKYGRKDMFTYVHRYLRLHSELLQDSVYKELYDYCRNTLIAYFKKDAKDENDDRQSGEVVDVLADIFNQGAEEHVNKHKPLVDELYRFWKDTPNTIKDIRV